MRAAGINAIETAILRILIPRPPPSTISAHIWQQSSLSLHSPSLTLDSHCHSRNMVQDSINVLLREYIGMADKTKATAPIAERPKGLAKIFVSCLCPPSDALDVCCICKVLKRYLTALSALIIKTGFLLVPALLWLIVRSWRDGHPSLAIRIALASLVALCLAEALVDLDWEQRKQRIGVFDGNSGPVASSAPAPVKPASISGTNSAQRQQATPTASTPAGRAANPAAMAPATEKRPSAPQASPAQKPAPDGSSPKVLNTPSSDMITLSMLEINIMGHQSPELPVGQRIKALCGHVGVEFPGGQSASTVSSEVVAAMLVEIKAAVGL